MSNQKKRTYNAPARQVQAAQTRKRVLDGARRLFQLDGFEAVTIEKIAQCADVSVPTIYSLFQSKRGVLRALMDEALPFEQYEMLEAEAKLAKSAKELLEVAAKFARRVYDAERTQLGIFRGASVLAPEFKEFEKQREQCRYQRQGQTFKMKVKQASLVKGLSLAQARTILWALTGRDLYRMLVVEQGWSSAQYERQLTKMLVRALLNPDHE